MYKVYLVSDYADLEISKKVLKNFAEVYYKPCYSEQELIDTCKDADAVLGVYEPWTAAVMDELPNLKFISLLSIGFDCVDINAAKERGIAVSNNPHYCLEEVANHAVAMTLALNRRLLNYDKEVKADYIWNWRSGLGKIHRLSEMTFALFGLGAIAKRIASRMQAFGCTVIAYDPYISKEIAEGLGVELVSMDEIYERADIISLNMPLTEETENFLNDACFNKMKKRPILVNCARGGLIDEDALIKALDEGKVSAVGLDVLSSETPDLKNSKLISKDNVLITPHAAFYSIESSEEGKVRAAKHIIDYFNKNYSDIPILNGVKN